MNTYDKENLRVLREQIAALNEAVIVTGMLYYGMREPGGAGLYFRDSAIPEDLLDEMRNAVNACEELVELSKFFN